MKLHDSKNEPLLAELSLITGRLRRVLDPETDPDERGELVEEAARMLERLESKVNGIILHRVLRKLKIRAFLWKHHTDIVCALLTVFAGSYFHWALGVLAALLAGTALFFLWKSSVYGPAVERRVSGLK